MFEIFQVVWDLFMMRRSLKSGELTVRKIVISVSLTALGYLILVPAAVLYDKNPAMKPLFIAAVVLTALDFLFLIGLGFYWWRQTPAKQS